MLYGTIFLLNYNISVLNIFWSLDHFQVVENECLVLESQRLLDYRPFWSLWMGLAPFECAKCHSLGKKFLKKMEKRGGEKEPALLLLLCFTHNT